MCPFWAADEDTGRCWFGDLGVVREVGSRPVQSTKGRPPVQGTKSFSVIWMIPPIVGFGGMNVGTEGVVPPVVRATGVPKGATEGSGEGAVGCAVAKGSSSNSIVDCKLSSRFQSKVNASSSSSRRDSGDPSRFGLDVGSVGESTEMVELRGQPYRFWAQ